MGTMRRRGIRKPGTSQTGLESRDGILLREAAALSLPVDDSATKAADLLPATPSGETAPRPLRWLARAFEATLLKRLNIGGKLTVGFGILVALTLLVAGLNYIGSLKAVT